MKKGEKADFFFKEVEYGRKECKPDDLRELIVSLRKCNFSAEEIVGIAQSKDFDVSYGYVYKLLKEEGFARLLRRSRPEKEKLELPRMDAPISSKYRPYFVFWL